MTTQFRDDRHFEFTAWSKEQGVLIDGIEASEIPHKGVGIVALRDLKAGEEILRIPVKALVTVDTDFVKAIRFGNGEKRTHAKVAAALTLRALQFGDSKHVEGSATTMVNNRFQGSLDNGHTQREDELALWRKTWPSPADLKASMPLWWSSEWRERLPEPTQALLEKQRRKFDEQWHAYLTLPETNPSQSEAYIYHWLLVNSRCFYWERPSPGDRGTRRKRVNHKRVKTQRPKAHPDDCMALVPFADYFNHADKGCKFDSDAQGCWVICDRDYEKGEEVVLSYGAHGNDFLLTEYGFCMEGNSNDSTRLDSLFREEGLWNSKEVQRRVLEDHGYDGEYVLSRDGVCFRTEVALCALTFSVEELEMLINGEEVSGQEQKSHRQLCEMLKPYLRRLRAQADSLQQLQSITKQDGTTEHSDAPDIQIARQVARRFEQMANMVSHVLH